MSDPTSAPDVVMSDAGSTKKRKVDGAMDGAASPANKAPSPGKDSPLPPTSGNKRMKPSPPQQESAPSSSASSSGEGGGSSTTPTTSAAAASKDLGWRRPERPRIRPSHDTIAFQIVDIDMCDGRPLAENPAKDPATGQHKQRPAMTDPRPSH